VLAGQPQAQVVLGQQHVRHPLQTSGSWSRTHSSFGAVKPVSASLPVSWISRSGPTAADEIALGRGALVVPQDRGPQHAPARVEQHQPVHLAGQADRHDVAARHARRGQRRRIADWAASTTGPGPARSTAAAASKPYSAAADAGDRAHLVDQDGLGRGGRDVDAEDERSRASAVPADGRPARSAG
jgi:hypothetical protein